MFIVELRLIHISNPTIRAAKCTWSLQNYTISREWKLSAEIHKMGMPSNWHQSALLSTDLTWETGSHVSQCRRCGNLRGNLEPNQGASWFPHAQDSNTKSDLKCNTKCNMKWASPT